MRFLRYSGIYRSDVSFQPVNPARVPPPVGRPRGQVIGRDGRRTPCPSSTMSSGRLILDQVGRHQSPSPLHRHHQHKTVAGSMRTNYHRTVTSVLTGCLTIDSGPKALPRKNRQIPKRNVEADISPGLREHITQAAQKIRGVHKTELADVLKADRAGRLFRSIIRPEGKPVG